MTETGRKQVAKASARGQRVKWAVGGGLGALLSLVEAVDGLARRHKRGGGGDHKGDQKHGRGDADHESRRGGHGGRDDKGRKDDHDHDKDHDPRRDHNDGQNPSGHDGSTADQSQPHQGAGGAVAVPEGTADQIAGGDNVQDVAAGGSQPVGGNASTTETDPAFPGTERASYILDQPDLEFPS